MFTYGEKSSILVLWLVSAYFLGLTRNILRASIEFLGHYRSFHTVFFGLAKAQKASMLAEAVYGSLEQLFLIRLTT